MEFNLEFFEEALALLDKLDAEGGDAYLIEKGEKEDDRPPSDLALALAEALG